MKKTTVFATAICVVGTAWVMGYRYLLRERCLHWGATPEEATREMPGDDLLPRPDIVSTRAVAIDVEAAEIWPWLVQFGPGRGGAYTYDWIENLLGLNMHSADSILPEFQKLSVGDTFALGDSGPTMRVAVLDPARALVFSSTDGNWVWAFALYPDGSRTRLISRNRIAAPSASPAARLFNRLIMEPGSWVMERKMLLGIKQRAERHAPTGPIVQPAPV